MIPHAGPAEQAGMLLLPNRMATGWTYSVTDQAIRGGPCRMYRYYTGDSIILYLPSALVNASLALSILSTTEAMQVSGQADL